MEINKELRNRCSLGVFPISVNEKRLVQVDANKRPVIISLVAINFLTIHLKHALVSKNRGHVLENLLFLTLTWDHQAKVEPSWDTESEHTIDVGSDDFKMHESSEKLLEASDSYAVKASLSIIEFLNKLYTSLLVLLPLGFVVSELSRNVTLFSECLHYIISVIFVYDNTVNLILIFVL